MAAAKAPTRQWQPEVVCGAGLLQWSLAVEHGSVSWSLTAREP